MVNIWQVAVNDTKQLVTLCISLGINIALAQKRHDLTEYNRLTVQQGMSQQLYLKEYNRLSLEQGIGQQLYPREFIWWHR